MRAGFPLAFEKVPLLLADRLMKPVSVYSPLARLKEAQQPGLGGTDALKWSEFVARVG